MIITEDHGRLTPKERYRAGVLNYKVMGYWVPDYEPKEIDNKS